MRTSVKINGACALSREPFPYNDIWNPVLKISDAFGTDRCIWGTDWTRTSGTLSYEQGVAPFRNTSRLPDSDRQNSWAERWRGTTTDTADS
jgi:predicted TIM-barrel fold metal-dependent hydrolase